ncbi:L-lactate dehydrogenase [Sandaracinobacter sp. RS1-74]|uniref:L-lactate dehydrogenase n=1 Tax=Sandaracinobacteroides sayramensis TaxID=2913411 RepID=UPI001EDBDC6E|nr:L-lactate dehydrogenase [Sandaracinobacteroides sayramensis]MCG2840548.1 L-lactate dehydrogenase [Sandaracinobacteroides sayramensis]
MQPRSVEDYRGLAARRLPAFMFEYVDSGSCAEVTMRRNRDSLNALALRQRVLRDVSEIDTSTELFGTRWALPFALSPVGMAGMLARRGEVQAARAAREAAVPFTLSSASVCPLEEVAAGTGSPFWFQLYMLNDRGYMQELLQRARTAGCCALLVTVDTPVLGTRYRDFRAGISNDPWPVRAARLAGQVATKPAWAWHVGLHGRPHMLGNMAAAVEAGSPLAAVAGWMQSSLAASLGWKDLEWIRDRWSGPLLLKGLLDAEDVRMAAASPIDGLVVSNHGGRQLDGAMATAEVLPGIVDAVGGRFPVLVDGGVRSGADILRMLALGASAVMAGRAWAYALAAAGGAGVERLLQLISQELRIAMALAGVTRIADIGPDCLGGFSRTHETQGRTI